LVELKIQVAGASHDTRLAYLPDAQGKQLRAALLAAHHGLDASTPEPEETPLAVVPTGQLVGSTLLSAPTLLLVGVAVALGVVADVSSKVGAAIIAASFVYLFGLVTAVWRRFNSQYRFTVAHAPDGIRVRRGLVGTVAETIPIRRVQAVRQVEPLWWRLFGWCRLEVDLAGVPGRERAAGSGQVTKTLLPVGSPVLAAELRATVLGTVELEPTRPPRRARLKSPLSYHFLSAAHDDSMAVTTVGRIRKVTSWVPLVKAQSVRRVQGPAQRRLGLATVHVDVAGRHAGATFRDRDDTQAEQLVEELVSLSRTARQLTPIDALPRAPAPALLTPMAPTSNAASIPPGWFVDPSGRHAGRWWDGYRWTENVDDWGKPGSDPY
jgi:putative membrane protein